MSPNFSLPYTTVGCQPFIFLAMFKIFCQSPEHEERRYQLDMPPILPPCDLVLSDLERIGSSHVRYSTFQLSSCSQ